MAKSCELNPGSVSARILSLDKFIYFEMRIDFSTVVAHVLLTNDMFVFFS